MKGEIHQVRAGHDSQSLEQEVVVWEIQVKNLSELLALQRRVHSHSQIDMT